VYRAVKSPKASHFGQPAQSKLGQVPGPLDLADDRLNGHVPQLVGLTAAFAQDLAPHPISCRKVARYAPARIGSVSPYGVLDLVWRNEGLDPSLRQLLAVAFAVVAGIRQDLSGNPACVCLDLFNQRHQMTNVRRLVGQVARHNDLALDIDGHLRVVALDEGVV